MNKIYKFIVLSLACFGVLACVSPVFGASSPTANAGPDLYVNYGQSITLQGSGYDPQGYSLTYYWNCSGGNLSSTSVAQPTFTAQSLNQNNQTNYTCTLSVTNSYSLSASDSMIVYVNNNNNNNGSSYIQTNQATNISNGQATLQGALSNSSYNTYVWFQWGTSTNYGNTSNQQTISYNGNFSQQIAYLTPNTTYHFRAVGQNTSGIIYGQDMTFYTNNSYYYGGCTGCNNSGILSAQNQVINLTSGNLTWLNSVTARPGDILSFAIALQPNGQDVHNVYIRDILPSGLIYRGNLNLNTGTYGGDITSGININTVYANQPVVVSYQAQVAPLGYLSYGANTLTNNVTVTSNEGGSQNASASVFVVASATYGASYISTGITNNFLTESFFLPLALIIFMLWLYFSGKAYKFADWVKTRI